MSSAYRCSNSSDNNNCNNGDKNNDNNYCRHRRIAKAAAIVVAMAMVTGVKAFDDRDDDKWVRLCTLMSDGNSRTNASTPCGVVVGNNYDPDDGNNNNNNHNSHNDHNNNNHDNHNGDDDYPKVVVETTETPHRVENAFVGGDLSAAADDGNSAGTAVVDNDDYNDRQHDTSDDGEDDSVDVEDDSAVGVEHDEVYDGGDGNEEPLVYEDDVVLVETAVDKVDENVQESTAQLLEHQRREGVAKVMLSYLMDAKNQFYNKIRYLLDLLQNAYFRGNHNHRRRRESTRLKRRKKQSVASTYLEPTFERSLMTMSFLMFGVFVIQVVQRLMNTMQQYGTDIPSLGNYAPDISDYLPSVMSSNFLKSKN